MSALVAVFGAPDALPDDAGVRRMLAAARRGDGPAALHRQPGCVLAVRRHAWETADGFGGPAAVVTEDGLTVVTDATLYHRDDLRRDLRARGVAPSGDTPGHLVLAAYRAWGERCPEHLEGDFAFVLWDERARRAVCARDFAGKRPLLYAEVPGALVVASAAGAVLAHPAVSAELNPASLAEAAAGMWAGSDETAFRAVRRLHPAHTLRWEGGAPARTAPHWSPPAMGSARGPAFDEAAEELRELLVRAAAERLPAPGPAAVWMSGGWDSTAVFAAGQDALRCEGRGGGALEVVSVSYPQGDPGREDELIQAVAGHWGRPVHWLRIGEIPMLGRAEERVAARDEPLAHVFETWNRALIGRTRELGARVALDGNGGDQLFFTSNVFFADLLVRGRWRELRREWRVKGGTRPRDFYDNAVRPLLSPGLARLVAALGGPRPDPVFERPVPGWIPPAFARRHGLAARERAHSPRPPWRGLAEREAYWYLTCPHFARAYGLLSGFALEAGVELRSPLLDRRVVELAAARPRPERNAGREVKRLLRRSMRGLLPDGVLAPRDAKTGTLDGYFARSMQGGFPALAEAALSGSPRLAELGIVEPGAFRAGLEEYARTGDGWLGYALHQTVQVELWLRAREGGTHRFAPAGAPEASLPRTRAPALTAAATPGRAPGASPVHPRPGGVACTPNPR